MYFRMKKNNSSYSNVYRESRTFETFYFNHCHYFDNLVTGVVPWSVTCLKSHSFLKWVIIKSGVLCTLQVTFCNTDYHFFKEITFHISVAHHFCLSMLGFFIFFTVILSSTAVTAANMSSLELMVKVLTNT